MSPDLYKRLSFRAVVDWIEIDVRTAAPTNFQTVRRRSGAPYVTALDAGAGGAATGFRFRIYDPRTWADVWAPALALGELAHGPEITAIEVSLDARSRGAQRAELVEQTARFYWLLARPAAPPEKRRLGRTRGTTEAIISRSQLLRKIDEGYSVWIGDNNRGSISQRIYFKQMDRGRRLPEPEHRARIEITLRGDALPFQTIEQAEAFRFESLAKWFSFRTEKTDLSPMMQLTLERHAQAGERRERRRRRGGGTRVYGSNTKADTPLNRRARDALRDLTRRMSAGRDRPRPGADIAGNGEV